MNSEKHGVNQNQQPTIDGGAAADTSQSNLYRSPEPEVFSPRELATLGNTGMDYIDKILDLNA
jgi:hypothetical protein